MGEIQAWIDADNAVAKAKELYDKTEMQLKIVMNQAQKAAEQARKEVERMMAETGEYEITEGNIKVAWSTPRMSVRVIDPDAVPEEFCKIERKPKLKEIKEYLETTECNWAKLEPGEIKLNWRYIK
jgi:hypothetical protein